jgi:hypothetical protein
MTQRLERSPTIVEKRVVLSALLQRARAVATQVGVRLAAAVRAATRSTAMIVGVSLTRLVLARNLSPRTPCYVSSSSSPRGCVRRHLAVLNLETIQRVEERATA